MPRAFQYARRYKHRICVPDEGGCYKQNFQTNLLVNAAP